MKSWICSRKTGRVVEPGRKRVPAEGAHVTPWLVLWHGARTMYPRSLPHARSPKRIHAHDRSRPPAARDVVVHRRRAAAGRARRGDRPLLRPLRADGEPPPGIPGGKRHHRQLPGTDPDQHRRPAHRLLRARTRAPLRLRAPARAERGSDQARVQRLVAPRIRGLGRERAARAARGARSHGAGATRLGTTGARARDAVLDERAAHAPRSAGVAERLLTSRTFTLLREPPA